MLTNTHAIIYLDLHKHLTAKCPINLLRPGPSNYSASSLPAAASAFSVETGVASNSAPLNPPVLATTVPTPSSASSVNSTTASWRIWWWYSWMTGTSDTNVAISLPSLDDPKEVFKTEVSKSNVTSDSSPEFGDCETGITAETDLERDFDTAFLMLMNETARYDPGADFVSCCSSATEDAVFLRLTCSLRGCHLRLVTSNRSSCPESVSDTPSSYQITKLEPLICVSCENVHFGLETRPSSNGFRVTAGLESLTVIDERLMPGPSSNIYDLLASSRPKKTTTSPSTTNSNLSTTAHHTDNPTITASWRPLFPILVSTQPPSISSGGRQSPSGSLSKRLFWLDYQLAPLDGKADYRFESPSRPFFYISSHYFFSLKDSLCFNYLCPGITFSSAF
ncbi:unnamed protein product [Protopolystoma xenopodis]|uniref:Uncharacterized protein n=1 Tax=Protopolystoma xenopodis TaxID=117903 RepID=A0A3S5CHP1_9PLAT|nr:unnamed protein product [Protopolystoma xenopodis]